MRGLSKNLCQNLELLTFSWVLGFYGPWVLLNVEKSLMCGHCSYCLWCRLAGSTMNTFSLASTPIWLNIPTPLKIINVTILNKTSILSNLSNVSLQMINFRGLVEMVQDWYKCKTEDDSNDIYSIFSQVAGPEMET